MTKYSSLGSFLTSSGQLEVKLSFSEIEKILGFKLPPSAHNYPAWWANNGHAQAKSWVGVGFITKTLDISQKTVLFCKKEALEHRKSFPISQPNKFPSIQGKTIVSNQPEWKQICSVAEGSSKPFKKTVFPVHDKTSISVCGYEFHFIQQLIPECENEQVKEYHPQKEYSNREGLPLLANGSGAFCRFCINAPAVSGVYLWLVDNQIIYIGETVNLKRRFNVGYGKNSPRNCYMGGQSTNCKMNKVVMEYYKCGKPISLYFHQTEDHKYVELDLLKKIETRYNAKDN